MTKKINKNNLLTLNFSNKNLSEQTEFKNFLKKKWYFMLKKELLYSTTFTMVYFFSKYWELGNLNNKLYLKYFFFNLKKKNKIKINFLKKNKKNKFFNNFLIEWLFFFKKFIFFILFNIKKNKIKLIKNFNLNKIKLIKNFNLNKIDLIKGFLFVWSTKNNFFVTILDYTGNTLVTRTGGNTGRTGTRQRSTVFSADNAMYECCFLAKERGIQSLIVHIWSSLWIQQIKHCFEGLTISGLLVESVVYRPLKSFGGCWLKKKWWV